MIRHKKNCMMKMMSVFMLISCSGISGICQTTVVQDTIIDVVGGDTIVQAIYGTNINFYVPADHRKEESYLHLSDEIPIVEQENRMSRYMHDYREKNEYTHIMATFPTYFLKFLYDMNVSRPLSLLYLIDSQGYIVSAMIVYDSKPTKQSLPMADVRTIFSNLKKMIVLKPSAYGLPYKRVLLPVYRATISEELEKRGIQP